MDEGRSFKAVGGSAGSLHSVGHSRWSTREDANLGKEDVLFLEGVEDELKSGRPKWVMARRPVNKLLPDSFWKLRSQMY